MASNINYISIDQTFPIAGKDNDSQGFRDNFTYIKNSFSAAKSEIEDIQLFGARKDVANNFNDQNITRANFVNCSHGTYGGGTTTTLIDYAVGSYQTFSVNANATIYTITGFPGVGAGKLTVHMFANQSVARYFSFNITGTNLFKSPAAKAIMNSIACTQTVASTDYITCASTANLSINQAIQFTGTTIGGLSLNTTYYVKAKDADGLRFSVSLAAGGSVVELSDATDTTMSFTPLMVLSATNPMVFEFYTVDNTNILVDYRGTFTV